MAHQRNIMMKVPISRSTMLNYQTSEERLISRIGFGSLMAFFMLLLHGSGFMGFVHDDRFPWDAIIVLFYLIHATIMLTIQACFFIHGYRFDLLSPESDSRDDQLRCIKTNFRSWTENFEYNGFNSISTNNPVTATKQHSMDLQCDLATYLIDPDIPMRTEYALADQIGLMFLNVVVNITAPSIIHLTIKIILESGMEPLDPEIHGIAIFVLMLFFLPALAFSLSICCPWAMKYYLWKLPGRLGRAMRMRLLVEHVQSYCSYNDAENVEGDWKEKLKWWVEKLLLKNVYKNVPKNMGHLRRAWRSRLPEFSRAVDHLM